MVDRFTDTADDLWVDTSDDSWFDQIEIISSGVLELLGNNNPTMIVPTGDGSLVLFGASTMQVRVDYSDDTNIFSILYKPAEISSPVCAKESTSFPLAFALEAKRPGKRFHSQDLTETEITFDLSFKSDTVVLSNINFNEFIIENVGLQDTFYAVKDLDTGLYNAFIRTEFTSGFNVMKIIIPAQATLNGESFFSIGSILCGSRATVLPKFNIVKKPQEPSKEMEFDNSNPAVTKIGSKFHEFDLTFRLFNNDDLNVFEDIVYFSKGLAIAIQEKFSEYEAIYLVERTGPFKYAQVDTNRMEVTMTFRGLK